MQECEVPVSVESSGCTRAHSGEQKRLKQEGAPTSISHPKLAGCCSGRVGITAGQCTDSKIHTSKQANGHAEMESTDDTVRGQEARKQFIYTGKLQQFSTQPFVQAGIT